MLKIIIGVLYFASFANAAFAGNLESNCSSISAFPDISEFKADLKLLSPDLSPIQFSVRLGGDSGGADAMDPLLGVRLDVRQVLGGDLEIVIVTDQDPVSARIKTNHNGAGFTYDSGAIRLTLAEMEYGYAINGESGRFQQPQKYIYSHLNRLSEDGTYSISEPGLVLRTGDSVIYGTVDLNRYSKETIGALTSAIIKAQLLDIQKKPKIGVPVPVPPVPGPVPHPPVPTPQPKPCPACPAAFSRTDQVPPSTPHYPCPGTHTHYYV